MTEINPIVWFNKRQLDFVPKHFVRAPTPITPQSLFWVRSMLVGRYTCQPNYENNIVFLSENVIYFEDPAEVTIYELKWAGTNIS